MVTGQKAATKRKKKQTKLGAALKSKIRIYVRCKDDIKAFCVLCVHTQTHACLVICMQSLSYSQFIHTHLDFYIRKFIKCITVYHTHTHAPNEMSTHVYCISCIYIR